MELFGFSAAKIITILIIAIVIFGPDKVPEMARTVGRTIRDARRYINEMTKEFNGATGDLREEFAGIAKDLRGELEATQADLRSQLDLTNVFSDVAAPMTEPSARPTSSLASGPDPAPAAPSPTNDEAAAHPAAVETNPLTEMAQSASLVAASRPDGRAALSRDGHLETDRPRALGASPGATRRAIGHSVAGSAYLRRKSAPAAPCPRLCRSARSAAGERAYGFTASHTPAPDLAAAP